MKIKSPSSSEVKNLRYFITSVCALVLLASCSSGDSITDEKESMKETINNDGWFSKDADVLDRELSLTTEEYRDFFNGRKNRFTEDAKGGELNLPNVSNLMVEPDAPPVDNDKLVTISVTEDVPLKEVLIELARRADIDIEIDKGITGGIIFRAKDRPFSEVIRRVTKLANLRYSIENGVLKIERDAPYMVNYHLNFLNMVRTSSSSVNITTDLIGGANSGSGGESGGLGGGSTSTMNSTSEEGDLWTVVEDGVSKLLSSTGNGELVVDGVAVAPIATGPIDPAQVSNELKKSAVISVNKQVGILSVFASESEHKEIKSYLDSVKMSQSSQVLIEAKILEVELNDEFRSGIDWGLVNKDNPALSKLQLNFDNLGLDPSSAVADQLFTVGKLSSDLFGVHNTSLDATIQLVEKFGVTRTLSSPRLQAMNNQFAVLTFAESFVYFELDVSQNLDETSGFSSLNVNSDIKTVPIGVILSLQPSIDLQNKEVTMNIRPTISRVTSTVEDPGVALIVAASAASGVDLPEISSIIPVVEKKEMDSVLRIKSGDIMVIGGLMENRSVNTDTGVPYISKVPFLGNAFKSVQKDTRTVETVIFIKATIMPAEGVVADTDKNFYKKFSGDRHPVKF